MVLKGLRTARSGPIYSSVGRSRGPARPNGRLLGVRFQYPRQLDLPTAQRHGRLSVVGARRRGLDHRVGGWHCDRQETRRAKNPDGAVVERPDIAASQQGARSRPLGEEGCRYSRGAGTIFARSVVWKRDGRAKDVLTGSRETMNKQNRTDETQRQGISSRETPQGEPH